MKTYLLQSPSVHTPRPLFAFESGAPLSRTTLTSHLRSLLQGQGLDEKRYASHSFRIGAVTAAGSTGLPYWLIKHWDVGLQTVMNDIFGPHSRF